MTPAGHGTLAYLGLGANLGDRAAALAGAVRALDEGGARVVRRSAVYETEPVGPPDQPWYLNQVLEVRTGLAPESLLDLALAVEAQWGRVRERRWGPRTLDVDVLLYGDLIVETRRLRIPHPRLTERRFVLVPLAELRPDLMLAGEPIGAWIARLPARPVVCRWESCRAGNARQDSRG